MHAIWPILAFLATSVNSTVLGNFRSIEPISARSHILQAGQTPGTGQIQNGGRCVWPKILTSTILVVETSIRAQMKGIDAQNTNPR